MFYGLNYKKVRRTIKTTEKVNERIRINEKYNKHGKQLYITMCWERRNYNSGISNNGKNEEALID